MHLLFAAMSGHGKSYHSQAWFEANADEYDHVVILDYSDEFRGLVKEGPLSHWIVGQQERGWSVEAWKQVISDNPKIVLARHLKRDEWREVAAKVSQACSMLAGPPSVLVGVDEAHFVAPQDAKAPEPVLELATTGRGDNLSSVWVTQRLAKLDKTVPSECDAWMLGAFRSEADLSQIPLEYPTAVHVKGEREIPGLPDVLHAPDAGPVPLRKFTEDGKTVGSEWVYSDDTGDLERIDTRDVHMTATHYGRQGKPLRRPPTG